MATRIADDMITPRTGRGSVYPWSEWTDGTSWEAERGKDFTCKVASFTVILHKQAKTLGKKVILSSTDDLVRFRFEDRPAGYVAPVRAVRAPKSVPNPVVTSGVSENAAAGEQSPSSTETAVVGNEAALPAESTDSSPDW